jgi:hypothetical protein
MKDGFRPTVFRLRTPPTKCHISGRPYSTQLTSIVMRVLIFHRFLIFAMD